MTKLINKSIEDIINFSQEKRLEHHDLLPDNFYESMDFFMSIEQIKMPENIHKMMLVDKEMHLLHPNSTILDRIAIPKHGVDMVLSKNFIFEIFGFSDLNTQEMVFVKKVLCFLFQIQENSLEIYHEHDEIWLKRLGSYKMSQNNK